MQKRWICRKVKYICKSEHQWSSIPPKSRRVEDKCKIMLVKGTKKKNKNSKLFLFSDVFIQQNIFIFSFFFHIHYYHYMKNFGKFSSIWPHLKSVPLKRSVTILTKWIGTVWLEQVKRLSAAYFIKRIQWQQSYLYWQPATSSPRRNEVMRSNFYRWSGGLLFLFVL